MSVVLQQLPGLPDESWLSYDEIDLSDLADVIERAQSEFAQIGAAMSLYDGVIATRSTSFTTSTSSNLDLGQLGGEVTSRRTLAGSGRGIEIIAYGLDIEVEATAYARGLDGTVTQIAQNSGFAGGQAWNRFTVPLQFAAGDVLTGGSPDHAFVELELQHRFLPTQQETGRWAHPVVAELDVGGGQLP
jgi:hypothetical protein